MRSAIMDFILTLSGSMALTILAKATVILLLGLIAGALSVRAQASWRHLVFATTFAAVLALPIVVMTIPELPVEVAASTQSFERSTVAVADETSASVQVNGPAVSTLTAQTVSSWEFPSLAMSLFLVWVGGALFLSGTLLVDLLRVRHFRRHGLPSEKLRGLIERLTIEARLKPVDTLLHENVQAPVTFGFFNPTIMLPVAAENWSEADLRRAIVHELEHIRRGDWATQIAARIACAFYWFHPLVWMAWRRLSLEAERSCDDAVVRTAGNADYAEQLVSLSRQLVAARTQPMLGMAKRSDLSHRVSSLLDATRSRGRAGLAAAAFAIFIGAFVVVSIGPLRAVAQVASKPIADKAQQKTANDPVTQRETSPAANILQKIEDGDDDDDEDDARGLNKLDSTLLKAAERNQIDRVKALLDEGVDVNAVIPGDGTALIAAARAGHLEMVRFLLDRGAKPNTAVGGDGNALIKAAEEGHRDVVVLLLDRGADINAGVEGDGNPLIMAAGAGHVGIVALLLERGADINKVVPGDENAIIKSCESGQLDVLKLLVSRGADVNSQVRVERGWGDKLQSEIRTPLSQARKNGHAQIVEYLLSVGAKQ